jgi:hypothetical protein
MSPATDVVIFSEAFRRSEMHKLSMKQLVTLSSKRFFMITMIIAKFPKTEIKMIAIKLIRRLDDVGLRN